MNLHLLEKIINRVTDPLAIVLLVVIFFLIKLLMKKEESLIRKDDQVGNMTDELHRNSNTLVELSTLLKALVYGRGRQNNDKTNKDNN